VIISPHARIISLSHRPHFFQAETTCRRSFLAHVQVDTHGYVSPGKRRNSVSYPRERNISASRAEDSVGHYATNLGRCINLCRALEPSQRGSVRFSERRGRDGNVFCFISPPRSSPWMREDREDTSGPGRSRVGMRLYSFGVGRRGNRVPRRKRSVGCNARTRTLSSLKYLKHLKAKFKVRVSKHACVRVFS